MVVINESSSENKLSLLSLSLFGVGIILGAGIYAILGSAAAASGASLWMSFLFAAIVALLTGLSYCELVTIYPKAGAEYTYLKNAYPDKEWAPFLLGFVLLFAGCATAATISIGFGNYLNQFVEISSWVSALGLLLVVSIINSVGVQNSSKVNIVFTLIEVIGLIIVIWYGFNNDNPVIKPTFMISTGTFSSAALIFFVYLGFEDIVNLAEDTQNPVKNIPKAIIISLVVTTILYIAVAIAVLLLTTPEILSTSNAPLSAALLKSAPQWVSTLNVIALFSTANTALITMLAVSRMIFGIAKQGDLPKFISLTRGKKKIPLNAILIIFILSGVFLAVGDLEDLASVSSFCALLGFLSVNWVVIALRFKKPELARPFKTPLNIGKFPLIAGLGLLTVIFMLTQFKLKTFLFSLLVIMLGVTYYYLKKKLFSEA